MIPIQVFFLRWTMYDIKNAPGKIAKNSQGCIVCWNVKTRPFINQADLPNETSCLADPIMQPG